MYFLGFVLINVFGMLFVLICMVYFELFRCRFNGDSSFNDDICFGLYSILWSLREYLMCSYYSYFGVDLTVIHLLMMIYVSVFIPFYGVCGNILFVHIIVVLFVGM